MSGLGPIGQIHLSARDVGAAVVFYRDVLGIPLLFEVPGASMAFFDCDGVRLYIASPESEEFVSRPLLYFRTDDIDAEWERLEALDVDVRERPHPVHRDDRHELWLAFFRDPEGTVLALMEERPQTTGG